MLYEEFIEKTSFNENYITFEDYNKYIEPIYMESKLDQQNFCKMFYENFTKFVTKPINKIISRLTEEEKESFINGNENITRDINVIDTLLKTKFINYMYLHGDELLIKQDNNLFINKNYENIPFRNADLRNHVFVNCNFNNCNMEKANLEGSSFICCDLNNANLYKTWLVNATFLNVNMENANVEEAVTEAITLDNNYSPSKKDKFYMKNCNYKNTLFEYVYDKKESLLEKAPITSKSKEYER